MALKKFGWLLGLAVVVALGVFVLLRKDSTALPSTKTENAADEVSEIEVLAQPPSADSVYIPPDNPDSLLIQALRACDLALARTLFKDSDRDLVNQPGQHGRTPLMYAASCGSPQLVSQLLGAGADPSALDASGNNLLFFLPAEDEPAVTDLLLAAGASASHANKVKFTPLMSAAVLGHRRIATRLLAAGATSAAIAQSGRNVLAEALLNQHLEMAELLSQAGCDLNPKLKQGGDLLTLLAEKGILEGVRFLLDHGIAVDSAPGLGEEQPPNALTAAVKRDRREVAALLLERGARVQSLDKKGLTTLQLAAVNGLTEMTGLLLDHGAAIDATGREETQSTALLLAAREGRLDTVRLLIDRGAAANAANRTGVTSLMYAAYYGDLALTQMLLAQPGLAVDAVNGDGNTPLVFAVVRNHPRLVDALLEAGANPNRETFIKAFGHVTPLILAAGRGYAEMTASLLRHGALVDTAAATKDFGQTTALILAAGKGYTAIVTQLLASGANPSLTDDAGLSALERAGQGGHTEVVSLLSRKSRPAEAIPDR